MSKNLKTIKVESKVKKEFDTAQKTLDLSTANDTLAFLMEKATKFMELENFCQKTHGKTLEEMAVSYSESSKNDIESRILAVEPTKENLLAILEDKEILEMAEEKKKKGAAILRIAILAAKVMTGHRAFFEWIEKGGGVVKFRELEKDEKNQAITKTLVRNVLRTSTTAINTFWQVWENVIEEYNESIENGNS